MVRTRGIQKAHKIGAKSLYKTCSTYKKDQTYYGLTKEKERDYMKAKRKARSIYRGIKKSCKIDEEIFKKFYYILTKQNANYMKIYIKN